MPKLVHGTTPDRQTDVRGRCHVTGCNWTTETWYGVAGVTDTIAQRAYAKHYAEQHTHPEKEQHHA